MRKQIMRRRAETLLADAVNLHPVLQRIYAARGVTSIDELENGLEQLLPFSEMKGIHDAANCLAEALQLRQRILVIGDFDADGATSSALAVSALQVFGAHEVSFLVPNRFEYGYGLTPEIVEVAAQRRPDLLITVDNGIASCEGVAAAKAHGMKVVITDHHLAGAELPQADAIVNPNQPGCPFKSKNLAGVGVIFYVMLALRSRLRELNWFAGQGIPEPNMGQFLDLVALGSVADVVPLDKNNRILVYQGVQRMRAGKCRPGILALIKAAKREAHKVCAADLGFVVAPRLNAAGRLDDMSLGIECLLASNLSRAAMIADQLDMLNQERRLIEAEMQQQAAAELAKLHLDEQGLPVGLCLFNEQWHQGVIGILAGRIKERLHRPVIVFALTHEHELKGSARSIAGVHIRDILDAIATAHPGVMTKFGGHAMAAGVSLPRVHFEQFKQLFDQEVRKHLPPDKLQGEIHSDGELAVDDCSITFVELIRNAGPWGQAFPEPVFDGRFKVIEQSLVGGKHLKMRLGFPESTRTIEAIAFNIDTDCWPNHRAEYINAAYRLDINEFRGQRQVQLLMEYLEPIPTLSDCQNSRG